MNLKLFVFCKLVILMLLSYSELIESYENIDNNGFEFNR